MQVADRYGENSAPAAEFVQRAARAGIYPVWYKSPLKCTYKPESKTPPQCEFTRVESWDELGDILRGLI